VRSVVVVCAFKRRQKRDCARGEQQGEGRNQRGKGDCACTGTNAIVQDVFETSSKTVLRPAGHRWRTFPRYTPTRSQRKWSRNLIIPQSIMHLIHPLGDTPTRSLSHVHPRPWAPRPPPFPPRHAPASRSACPASPARGDHGLPPACAAPPSYPPSSLSWSCESTGCVSGSVVGGSNDVAHG
jgi:hypothetical protein